MVKDQVYGLPYERDKASIEGVATLPDRYPTKTISGKNVTPDRADVTGVISDRFGGLIDIGFDALGDRIRDQISGGGGSITGNPTGVIDQNAVNGARYGSMGGGVSPLLLLAAGGVALFLLMK